MRTRIRPFVRLAMATVAVALVAVACGSDSKSSGSGAGIKLAVNPWTGSAVNANVAKIVLESKLGTPTTWSRSTRTPPGSASMLEVSTPTWRSGRPVTLPTTRTTSPTRRASSTSACSVRRPRSAGTCRRSSIDQHPELATWEGFKDPALAKLFATAETGDQGQFLMGDPSYVTYDEQIIKNLNLPLKFVGRRFRGCPDHRDPSGRDRPEAAAAAVLAAALVAVEGQADRGQAARRDRRMPGISGCGRRQLRLRLRPGPAVQGGQRQPEAKNKAAFDFLSKFQLTTDQQNEIAGDDRR